MQLDFLQQKNPPVFKMDREGFPSCPLLCWDLQPGPCETGAQIGEHLNLRRDHVGWQAGQGGGQSAGVTLLAWERVWDSNVLLPWEGSISRGAHYRDQERREKQLYG